MDDILKEAIADAKALRATALENAKIALEEAFTPRLKNMLSQKIQSEEMPDNEEYGEGEGEVGSGDGHMEAEGEHEVDERMHDEEDDKKEVDERMHDEEDDDKEVEERMHGEDDDEKEVDERMHDEDEHQEDEGMHDEGEHQEDEGMHDEGEHQEDEGMHDEDMHDEDELDLESVIKELEEELDSSNIGDAENEEPSERSTDSSEVGAQGPEGKGADEEGGNESEDDTVVKEPVVEGEHQDEDEDEVDEDIDLEEVIKALSEEEHQDEDEDDKVDEMKTQLKEYKDTIGYLREKLNEVNLLNAKLLFTNKLFRGFGLNNNQKLRVVEQFDRAQNLREIKLVYATLAESFKGNGNKRVNESKGQASKAVASTEPKKEVLSEGQEMKNRFKKLANLI